MDAIHEATGKAVYIKEVPTDSEELHIAQMLMQEEWVDDPRNHCVRVTKVFKDHKNSGVSYIIMPLLRPVDTPHFESVKEIIKFADQILEVTLTHPQTFSSNRGFTRDWYSSMRKESRTGTNYHLELRQLSDQYLEIAFRRTLMDGDVMYPEGWHPISIAYKPDRSEPAEHTSRTAAKVKY